MYLESLSCAYQLSHPTADATDGTFPSKVPTVTRPSGDGVIDFFKDNNKLAIAGVVPQSLRLLPIGTGANNAVLTGMRVISWDVIYPTGSGTGLPLYIPTVLAEFATVFGNIPGIAGAVLGSTYFFMDTITVVTGNANVSEEVLSNAADLVAHAVVVTKGAQLIEITFDLGANATGANCLVKRA